MRDTDTHRDFQTAIPLVNVLYHSSTKISRSGSISLHPFPPRRRPSPPPPQEPEAAAQELKAFLEAQKDILDRGGGAGAQWCLKTLILGAQALLLYDTTGISKQA